MVFAGAMPTLPRWLAAFALPSLVSIVATFGVLALISRRDLRGATSTHVDIAQLGKSGGLALAGIGLTAIALLAASAFDAPLGATTCACGVLVFVIAALRDRAAFAGILRSVSWTVLVLVAGLFVPSGPTKSTFASGRRHRSPILGPPALAALPRRQVWGERQVELGCRQGRPQVPRRRLQRSVDMRPLRREGLVHRGIALRFAGRTHRIDLEQLAAVKR